MRQLKISKQITNRESQSLDKYLQEIGKVDLLTPDEEVTLAQKIRDGDHDRRRTPAGYGLPGRLGRGQSHLSAVPGARV